jgi:hypothetical protein
VTAFAEMMTARTGSRDLERWLAAVEADDQAGLRSFTIGIRHDQQAVANGLTLHWNSGKVEGTVNKIKMIKRQMYGRAGFDLLRKRVILHPALPDHKIRGRALFRDWELQPWADCEHHLSQSDVIHRGRDELTEGVIVEPRAHGHAVRGAGLLLDAGRLAAERTRTDYVGAGELVRETGDRGGRISVR